MNLTWLLPKPFLYWMKQKATDVYCIHYIQTEFLKVYNSSSFIQPLMSCYYNCLTKNIFISLEYPSLAFQWRKKCEWITSFDYQYLSVAPQTLNSRNSTLLFVLSSTSASETLILPSSSPTIHFYLFCQVSCSRQH